MVPTKQGSDLHFEQLPFATHVWGPNSFDMCLLVLQSFVWPADRDPCARFLRHGRHRRPAAEPRAAADHGGGSRAGAGAA